MELSDKNIPSNGTIFIETTLLHTSFIEEAETKLQVKRWMLKLFYKNDETENLQPYTFIRESQQPQNLMLKCLCFDNPINVRAWSQ